MPQFKLSPLDDGLSFWGSKTVEIDISPSVPRGGFRFSVADSGGLGSEQNFELNKREFFEKTTFFLTPLDGSKFEGGLLAMTRLGPDKWIAYTIAIAHSNLPSTRAAAGQTLKSLLEMTGVPRSADMVLLAALPGSSASYRVPSTLEWDRQWIKSAEIHAMLRKDSHEKPFMPCRLRLSKTEPTISWLWDPKNLSPISQFVGVEQPVATVVGTRLMLAHPIGIAGQVSHTMELLCFDHGLAKYLERLLVRQEDNDRQATVMVLGQTGVGKSSTINALVGRKVADTDDYTAKTKEITSYKIPSGNTQLEILDTPGFCDELEEEGNDDHYMQMVQDCIGRVGCLLYVTKLDETRVRADEKRTIKLISEALGDDIWDHSVIVFTRADKATNFEADIENRARLLVGEISKYRPVSIPVVAASNDAKAGRPISLPNGKEWTGELLARVYERSRGKQSTAFLTSYALAVQDNQREREEFTPEQEEIIRQRAKKEGLLAQLATWLFELLFSKAPQ